jgi:hypothetical protein
MRHQCQRVRDHDDRYVRGLVHAAKQRQHLGLRALVKVTRRLVGKDDPWPIDQRAGKYQMLP